ncbi:MAG TPA: LLM class flavin-dependent oxidoreductase [Stellaceae bacterium]|nr:LLM class flavin-dependent oxidoreductase [Stellaceae bacterium]
MRVYHMTEEPYPDAWNSGVESLRVNLPNRLIDPATAADLYHRFLDEWQLCDELGINIFVNEHHSTATCLTASCNIVLGILAKTTKRVRILGLGIPIANRPDPLRVAEECAMIDVISRGRFDMGFIKGVPYEIVPSNARPTNIVERFWEAHDLIIKALTTHDGPFSWESENFHYRSVNIFPRPWQQPHPPVWVSVNSPGSVRPVAERGYVLGTVMTGYKAKGLFDEYRRVWRAAGRPDPVPLDRFCYCCFMACGHSEEEGLRRGNDVMAYLRTNAIVGEQFRSPPGYIPPQALANQFKRTGRAGFSELGLYDRNDRRISGFVEANVDDAMRGGLLFAGTPDQVYRQIVEFYETIGGFGVLQMMAQAGTMSHEDTVDSLTLFAREVMPRLEEYHASRKLAAA